MSNPHYRLIIETLPSTAGTPISRLRKVLKMLTWHRFRCCSIEEITGAVPQPASAERRGPKADNESRLRRDRDR
jgi:hypothetical protein